MSGYKLVLGFITIIIITFLWIVFNEVFMEMGGIFNAMATDADVIARNNMGMSIFYYSLFFMIIVIAIYVLKSSLEEKKGYVVPGGYE